MIHVGLLGGTGRMGRNISELLANEFAERAELTASGHRGTPLSPLLDTDVIIDFSLPEAMLALKREMLSSGRSKLPAVVTGTTGWKLDERKELEELAEKTAVVMSSNFSLGVNALLQILRQASPLLEKLGYRPVVIETHHIHKKDAPSGTALSIQRALSPEGPGNVPVHSIRAGEVIGDHQVQFHGKSDEIRISHTAHDRAIFARGAIEAALWIATRKSDLGQTGKILGLETFLKERLN